MLDIIDEKSGKQGELRKYVDKNILGEEIKKSLLTKYIKPSASQQKNGAKEGFYIGYREEYIGLMTQSYGGVSLFLLMNCFDTKFTNEENSLLIKIVNDVLSHIDTIGFDLDPYIESSRTKGLLDNKNLTYFDSMSWVFSLLIHARYANRTGKLVLPKDVEKKIIEKIKYILSFYVKNVIIKNKKPAGWGFVDGCEDPSLYFTYAVLESFNDFDDYVIGDKEIGTTQDSELLDEINKENPSNESLQDQFQRIKYSIGENYWNQYKSFLGNDFFNENKTIISKDQIRNSTKTSALFNTLFVLLILIYTEADLYAGEKLKERSPQERERMLSSFKQSLHQVLGFYDVLKNEGLDSIVDRHILTFDQNHPRKKEFLKIFSVEDLQTTTLTPLLIKVNSLITFYIVKFPEKEMSRYLDMAVAKRVDKEQWLWDDSRYDLVTTERYIEALLDFYDYYYKFETQYLENIFTTKKREEALRMELSKSIREDIEKLYKEEREKQVSDLISEKETKVRELINEKEKALVQLETSIRKEYKLENDMRSLIKSVMEEEIGSVVTDLYKKVASFNRIGTTEQNDGFFDELNAISNNYEKLSKMIEVLIRSYFYKFLSSGDNLTVKEDYQALKDRIIEQYFPKDIGDFFDSYLTLITDGKSKIAIELTKLIKDRIDPKR